MADLLIRPEDIARGDRLVTLPASKSLAARRMMCDAYSGRRPGDGSECDDLRVLRAGITAILGGGDVTVDVEASGTALRFLLSLSASAEGTVTTLTGIPRLQERPVGDLVGALRTLGADISYLGRDGFAPLLVKGKQLKSKELHINASVSSQYISSLMLLAPTLSEGLTLELYGEAVSRPYIEMTAAVMHRFGARVELGERYIAVAGGGYPRRDDTPVEGDWSAASYVLETVSLLPVGESLRVWPLLPPELSLQGDAVADKLFRASGVEITYGDGFEARVRRVSDSLPERVDADMRGCPDLVPAFAAAMAGRTDFRLSGIGNLRLKECDRIDALAELLAYFCPVREEEAALAGRRSAIRPDGIVEVFPRGDHRIAMAAAPLALRCEGVLIHDAECVAKSFPDFFRQILK